jgi:hypothetical protein
LAWVRRSAGRSINKEMMRLDRRSGAGLQEEG